MNHVEFIVELEDLQVELSRIDEWAGHIEEAIKRIHKLGEIAMTDLLQAAYSNSDEASRHLKTAIESSIDDHSEMLIKNALESLEADTNDLTTMRANNVSRTKVILNNALDSLTEGKVCVHCEKKYTVSLTSTNEMICNSCKKSSPFVLKDGQKSILERGKIGGRNE